VSSWAVGGGELDIVSLAYFFSLTEEVGEKEEASLCGLGIWSGRCVKPREGIFFPQGEDGLEKRSEEGLFFTWTAAATIMHDHA